MIKGMIAAASLLALMMPFQVSAAPRANVPEAAVNAYKLRLEKLGALRVQHTLCLGAINSALRDTTLDDLALSEVVGMTVSQAQDILRDSEITASAELGFRCISLFNKSRADSYMNARDDSEAYIKAELAKAQKPE